jgi:hypothetical protein
MGPSGPTGAAGAQGVVGPTGATGPTGPSNTADISQQFGPTGALGPEGTTALVAVCPAGQVAVAGGWFSGDEISIVNSYRSTTTNNNDSWTVNFHNDSATDTYTVQAIAYCSPA